MVEGTISTLTVKTLDKIDSALSLTICNLYCEVKNDWVGKDITILEYGLKALIGDQKFELEEGDSI